VSSHRVGCGVGNVITDRPVKNLLPVTILLNVENSSRSYLTGSNKTCDNLH
jgi:hypothetical protein